MSSAASFKPPGDKWWDNKTVAVLTGANKGVGYGIASILAQQGLQVIVAARNDQLGKAAADKIKQETGGQAVFRRLDITDKNSIQEFAANLRDDYGGLTILVNNAGFAYKGDAFGADEAQQTIDVNYFGTKAVCEALVPLLTQNGRIVNVSSRSGLLNKVPNAELRQRCLTASSTQQLDELAQQYVQAIRDGSWKKEGWPSTMYGFSKILCTHYSRVLAEQLKPKHIMVNAICPGYVNTDMTSGRGTKTIYEGADTPAWLALMPQDQFITGKLLAERQEISF
jgi:carbonyl reductase 1